MNRFTNTLWRLALLLVLVGLTVGDTNAQDDRFAAVNGIDSGSCKTPATACNLPRAVQRLTTAGVPATLYLQVQNVFGSNVYQSELIDETLADNPHGYDADIDLNMAVSTFREVTPGSGIYETDIPGTAAINGRIHIKPGVALSINTPLDLVFLGNKTLALFDGAWVGPSGDFPAANGRFIFGAQSGTQQIFLGDITDPGTFTGTNTGSIWNMVIQKGNAAAGKADFSDIPAVMEEVATNLDAFSQDVEMDGTSRAPASVSSQSDLSADKSAAGVVIVDDQGHTGEGVLLIPSFLTILSGTLDMNGNDIAAVGTFGTPGVGIFIEEGSGIVGDATLWLSPTGFANNGGPLYPVLSDGFINMNITKNTDAGVRLYSLEVGAGGESFNNCGRLDIIGHTINGLFHQRNASAAPYCVSGGTQGARTNLWLHQTLSYNKASGTISFGLTAEDTGDNGLVTSGLVIEGPGDELDTQNGLCDADASGVYAFLPITLDDPGLSSSLAMTNTDDLGTAGCTEGVSFVGERASQGWTGKFAPGMHMSLVVGDAGFSGVCDTFFGHPTNNCEADDVLSGVSLGFDTGSTGPNAWHNVGFEGDLIADNAPRFHLGNPADAFGAAPGSPAGLPMPADCLTKAPVATGNKVYFVGGNSDDTDFNGKKDQLVIASGIHPYIIESVGVVKDDTNDEILITPTGVDFLANVVPPFNVPTSLEIINGEFITNGWLNMNQPLDSSWSDAVVVVNQDGNGKGFMASGTSPGSYFDYSIAWGAPFSMNSSGPEKNAYEGTQGYSTDAELMGPDEGSQAGIEVVLPYIEVRLCATDPSDDAKIPVITLDKGVSVKEEIRLTEGIFEVGSEVLTLWNEVTGAIGNGDIFAFNPSFEGNISFPDITEASCGSFDNPGDSGKGGDSRCAGDDGIDLLYFGEYDRTVGLLYPNSDNQPWLIRNLEVSLTGGGIGGPTISLREGEPFRVSPGDADADGVTTLAAAGMHVRKGQFDIVGNEFEVNARNGNNNELFVYRGGNLVDSADDIVDTEGRVAALAELDAFRQAVREGRVDDLHASASLLSALETIRAEAASKSEEHAGLLRYMGRDNTHTWIDTHTGRLSYVFPSIEVSRTDGSHVVFDANGVPATTFAPIPPNMIDRLSTAHFTLVDADRRPGTDGDAAGGPDHLIGAGGVYMTSGLDHLDIATYYTQFDGEFQMAGTSSICLAPCQPVVQRVSVGTDLNEVDGEFFTDGGDVDVFGDFFLGDFENVAKSEAAQPSDAKFSLMTGGILTTVGSFNTAPDSNPDERAVDADEDGDTVFNPLERNVFECGWGSHVAFGDVWHFGTGDGFDDNALPRDMQGLNCTTLFVGASQQDFTMRQDEDSFFNHVVMAGQGLPDDGVLLHSDFWTNRSGTWLFEYSIVDTNEEVNEVIILNPTPEGSLALRNNPPRGGGTVQLGSRDSYVNGRLQRVIEIGTATGGGIGGGGLGGYAYFAPIGDQSEIRDDGNAGTREVDHFNPFMLQLVDDLGRSSLTRMDFRQSFCDDDECSNLEWPDEGLVVDAVGGGTLTLDVLAPNYFWQLDLDRIPSFDPNVRVEADDLNNVFDITSMRIIQWDCVDADGDGVVEGGANPRLAGLYDLDVDPVIDDGSFVLNDFINNVPNMTQEGVDVNDCNLFGLASNFLINPINLDELPSGLARVQIIHNSPDAGAVDIYVDDKRLLDDFIYRSATPFVPVPGGSHKIDIVAGSDASNSNPVWTGTSTFTNDKNYVVVAHGFVADLRVVIEDNIRLASGDQDEVEFFLVHGDASLGPIDIRLLDPVDNNTVVGLLANNFDFNDVGAYISLPKSGINSSGYNIQVTNADNSVVYEVFRAELNSRGGQTFVWNMSANKDTPGFNLLGAEVDGSTFLLDIITATEGESELPTEFALKGNYPNPFNPSTTIQFDLPETAEVTVEVVDMLGRNVMALPVQMMEAGANRSFELNASNLASGTYLYRVVAKTATDTMIKTGRMTLIK